MLARGLFLGIALTGLLAPSAAFAAGPLRAADEPTVLKASRDPQWSATGFDPVLVLFSSGACESNTVDIELWSRDLEEWIPHPRHSRLVTGGCAVEDAGKLLNEIRVRCVDPTGERRSSPWRVGANVWHPVENSECTADAAELHPLLVSITSPVPGDTVRAERGFTTVRGSVELGVSSSEASAVGVDRLRIDNLSTAEFTEDVILESSGHFIGHAPVVAGINRLRVSAVGRDGRFGSADLEIEFQAPDEREQLLAAERERMRRVREKKQKTLELSVEGELPAND